MLYFLSGCLFSLFLCASAYSYFKLKLIKQANEKKYILHEKKAIDRFRDNLLKKIGKEISKEEKYKIILQELSYEVNAVCGCMCEFKSSKGEMEVVASEGLLSSLSSKIKKGISRVQQIDNYSLKSNATLRDSLMRELIAKKKGIFIKDTLKDKRILKHKDSLMKAKSIMLMPIIFEPRLIGAFVFVNSYRGKFSEVDFSLLKSLVVHVGFVLNSQELFELQVEKNKIDFDLKLASNVQNLVLKETSHVKMDGIETDVYYRPAKKIGGDLYRFIPLSKDRLAFVIADVAGKGIAASLLMSVCLTHLKHYTLMYENPKKILSELNSVLYKETGKDIFITMGYGILDLSKDEIKFVRAGHEPIIIYKHCGNHTELFSVRPNGMPLGMVESNLFDNFLKEETISFGPGTGCLLYTDGVTEALNSKNEEFSRTLLADIVKKNCNLSAKELTKVIVKSIDNFAGETYLGDDITLLNIKRTV